MQPSTDQIWDWLSQVPDPEAKIAYVAQRLGLTPLSDSGGKLETYIRR